MIQVYSPDPGSRPLYPVGFKLDVVKQPGAAHRGVAEVMQLDGAGAPGGADGRFENAVGEGGGQRIFERIQCNQGHTNSFCCFSRRR
jgi:hypothetical protein